MTDRTLHVMCRCLNNSCPHARRREFDTVVSADWEYDHPLLAFYADEFKASDYPTVKTVLARVLHKTIVIRESEAEAVLLELECLEEHRLPGTTTVLVDEAGKRVWPYLEPDCLGSSAMFNPLYCTGGTTFDSEEVLVIGLEGGDILVKRAVSYEEVLRGRQIRQRVTSMEPRLIDGYPLRFVTFWNPDLKGMASDFAQPVHRDRMENLIARADDVPRLIEVREVPLTLAATLSFPRWLTAAAWASLLTSNPVVGTHLPGTQ